MNDEDKELSAFLSGIADEDPRLLSSQAEVARTSSGVGGFIQSNWVSFLLLAQSITIVFLFVLLLTTQSKTVFMLYAIMLLARWANYGLVVYALFNDRTKWLAVVAGVIYTVCTFSGRLLVVGD